MNGMSLKVWKNEGGYQVTLLIVQDKRARLSIYREGVETMSQTYDYYELRQAERDAEALVMLGSMQPCGTVGAAL